MLLEHSSALVDDTLNRGDGEQLVVPRSCGREVLLEVEALESCNQIVDGEVVPSCEGDISNGDLASNEPILFGQNGLEHSEDTENLPLVSFNSGRNLLSVVDGEPCNLSKVRSLTRGLEEEPLEKLVLLAFIGHGESLLLIVSVDEVEQDSIGLPENEVVVAMVNNGWNTTVRVQFEVIRVLLLGSLEVEEDGLKSKSKLLEDGSDLPSVRTANVGVESELFSMRHIGIRGRDSEQKSRPVGGTG